MKKIKITENQKSMLETKASAKLKEGEIPYSQSGSFAVEKEYKLGGVKVEGVEEPTEEVQMSELAPKVLDFIKQLYTKPSMDSLDPFWDSVDVSWDELIQLLTELNLIKSVSNGYRLQPLDSVGGSTAVVRIVTKIIHKLINDKKAPEPIMGETDRNDPVRKELSGQLPTEPQRTGKTRAEILKVIAAKRAEELKRRELEEDESNLPAGAANDPAAAYNQVDPPVGKQPSQQVLNLEFYLDEIALFSKDGKLYLYNVDTADEGEYEQEAKRTETPLGREDGQMDVEYGEWEMNGDIVNAYVNNNLEHLSTGKGLNDYESGVELVEIDSELVQDLLGLTKYIKDPKAAEQLNSILNSIGLEEMTSSGGDGALGGGALGDVPIGKMSASPIAKSNVSSEMKTIVDSEEEQAEPAMEHARRLLNGGDVTPQEWLSYGNELKQVVDEMRDDSSTGYLAAFLVHMLQLADKGMENKFNAVRDRLMGKLADPKHNMQLEMDTVSAGNYMYDVNALGTDDFMTAGNRQNKSMPMVKKSGVNEVVAREGKDAKTDTQWPDGKFVEFVEFDDCVKYNNNKVAQNGGCSTGAVDNVVKTKGSKNSVISDSSIYESIAKETRRTIEEVKSILSRKNKKSK